MLARLWWKEYRMFGPVWLILGLAAGLLQWALLSVNSEDTRSGSLTNTALAWAVLYAFAVGAAAFAGERESKTLGFLDALPVGRWALWMGKGSFAVVTTYGLALFLAGLAATGTEKRDPNEMYAYDVIVRVFATLLFEAVAWSLLWSAMTKNPLIAGVLGVISVYLSAMVTAVLFSSNYVLARNELVPLDPRPRLVVALTVLALSGVVMTWRPKLRRPSLAVGEAPAPLAIRASSTGRSLIWQAAREGSTTWVLLGVAGLLAATAPQWGGSPPTGGGIEVIVAVIGSLLAGVSVFGSENVTGSRRFLVHHGVPAGTVWWRKVLSWVAVVGGVYVAAATFVVTLNQGLGRAVEAEGLAVAGLGVANGFAVGLLCGMAITRRMTAGLVGFVAVIAILPFQVGAVLTSMVPTWTAFLIPLALVAASRGWADDWMHEREGPAPWLRLAAWTVAPTVLLLGCFVTYRAFGIADVGPQYVVAGEIGPAILPGLDAAEEYRRAVALIHPDGSLFNLDNGARSWTVEAVVEDGWQPQQAQVVGYWRENLPAIERARKASSLALARFEDVGRTTIASNAGNLNVSLRSLGQLLALDARARMAGDDLPGAWDDILAEFRMANQLSGQTPNLARLAVATRLHCEAVGVAFGWLGSPELSAELARKALADLTNLPSLANPSAAVRVEAGIIDRSLDLPVDDLAMAILPSIYGRKPSSFEFFWFAKGTASPWERERARRACRLLISRYLPEVVIPPYQRGMSREPFVSIDSEEFQRGSLTHYLMPNFQAFVTAAELEQVAHLALVQAAAVEAWKLEHKGEYPATLEALVPSMLALLPLDPYSGKTFGYVKSDGRPVPPPSRTNLDPSREIPLTRPGQPLLYSVGPNRLDDGGQGSFRLNQVDPSALVFPIP